MKRLAVLCSLALLPGCGSEGNDGSMADGSVGSDASDSDDNPDDDSDDDPDDDGNGPGSGPDDDGNGPGSGPDDDGNDTSDDDSDDTGEPIACETDAMFPAADWPVGEPADFGLDAAGLEAAALYASENDSNCMAVVRHGHLVFERYWEGTDENTKQKSWSVAKSYASTVAGIALERGDLGTPQDSIAEYLPQLAGTPKENISLWHLMTMSSGLYMDLIDDNLGITGAPDMTQKALDLQVSNPPGVLWEYNNHAVQLLEPVIRAQTGISAEEYARQHLWEPIGMDAEWIQDEAGQPALYQNVLASCRDHARFGYLFLNNGCWDGTQIVSEAWVEEATTPSTTMNPGYGYWWWLSGESPTLDSTDFSELPGGSLHPYGPDDSYCAVGLGSQFIEVIPSLDMVVVRMGIAPHDDPAAWLNPLEMIQKLLEDGKQPVHNGVLERVLNSVTDG